MLLRPAELGNSAKMTHRTRSRFFFFQRGSPRERGCRLASAFACSEVPDGAFAVIELLQHFLRSTIQHLRVVSLCWLFFLSAICGCGCNSCGCNLRLSEVRFGVVWARFGAGLGLNGAQTGPKVPPNDPGRTSDYLKLQPHELQPHP